MESPSSSAPTVYAEKSPNRTRRRLYVLLLLSLGSHFAWLLNAKPLAVVKVATAAVNSTATPSSREIQQLIRPYNRKKRILFFLHIHKSGGSTMCTAAGMNRLKVDKRHNCNVQPDQRCCGGADTMQAQAAFAAHTKYDFVANEDDMYESMDLAHYQYIVVLRNSAVRYRSHWIHVRRELKNYTATFDSWWQAQPDNWNVRKLCGTRCQNVSKYQMTRELFDYTVARLRAFDHVLLLEHWNDMYPSFADAVGWQQRTPKPQNRNQDKKTVNKTPLLVGKSAWDPFMSVLDDAVYEWVLARHKGEDNATNFDWMPATNETMERYFENGRNRNCENPCCAETCSTYR